MYNYKLVLPITDRNGTYSVTFQRFMESNIPPNKDYKYSITPKLGLISNAIAINAIIIGTEEDDLDEINVVLNQLFCEKEDVIDWVNPILDNGFELSGGVNIDFICNSDKIKWE